MPSLLGASDLPQRRGEPRPYRAEDAATPNSKRCNRGGIRLAWRGFQGILAQHSPSTGLGSRGGSVSIFQDEIHPENHLERSTQFPSSEVAEVQRKRMLIALGILLVALVAVVLKDWDFWFPPAGEVQEAAVRRKSKSMATVPPPRAPAAPTRERKAGKFAGTRCGRRSLCGNHRARSAATSGGGSGGRKPPHHPTREKQCHPSGCELGRDLFPIRRSCLVAEWAGAVPAIACSFRRKRRRV